MTFRPRLFWSLTALVLSVSACSSSDADAPTPPEDVPAASSSTTVVEPSTATTLPGVAAEFIPDYSVLIATIESAMEGTSYEGVALKDPEVFIATAELFCGLLEEGMTTDELLAEYLDRLSEEGSAEVDEDDGLMAGVLLGASVEIVCPDPVDEST